MRYLTLVTTALGAILMSQSAALASPAGGVVAITKAMSAQEVADIYKDKTWTWQNGAGYFGSNHRFRAWSGSGKAATFATGKWSVTGKGQLCFDATWSYGSGSRPAKTCFSHRKNDTVVYQRKDPSGEWYVFKGDPIKEDDEVRKLQDGDRVSSKFKRVSANVKKQQQIAEAKRLKEVRQRAREADAQKALNEDYMLFKQGKYRQVLARLDQRARTYPESREAGVLRGWSLYQLSQYDKAREQFAALDKKFSTRETKYGLYYSGAVLDPLHLGD
jgi:Protein of unknown function (DUF995).